MKKVFIGVALIMVLIMLLLIYNYKQIPTDEDVMKYTENWSLPVEEVYLVKEIDGEWLTIFRDNQSVMIARLEQNWLGDWEIKNENGSKNAISTIDYPITQDDEFNWSAGTIGKQSHYFGQILNTDITKIEVETQKNLFEEALIINPEESRFFYLSSEDELVLPVNIRGFSENGELIYSTVNPTNKVN